ncbi:centrosomal protein of 135 kDa-like [Gossypium hirsutum]|uniref:Centrosomal protein of 135 kDa-like n=1 Tax=Gossypium hirsutum TaxID=3635 RepID=A0ABM3BBS4_GOSHI|nr:centrosomal protein of 135 kDa-like [Gossypium hirsutum]
MEEEKMNLRLDIDAQKLETEGLRKGKHKVEEDLNSLKKDYKRLRLSVRTAGLGKTSELWCQEVQEEKAKADRWEKRFQEAQKQNKSFERSLSESQNERDKLKARVAKLEKIVYQYRNRNSVAELQASLRRIEQMKKTIEELEIASQNYEARIEHLEANEDHQSEQLHHLQDQVARRDHIMGEAVVQIQGVAEHLQTLAIQADVLSVKYESESDQGQKLASLLREIKVLINLETNQPTRHRYGTRAKTKDMDQRLEKLEQYQKKMQDRLQLQMQERLDKMKQEMSEKMRESQEDIVAKLTRLITNGGDKGKGPMADVDEGNDDELFYPPGFTPPHERTQAEYPRKSTVTIMPQQFRAVVEKERMKEELPKQLEERCRWLEEKFKAMEVTESYRGIDAK